MESTVRRVVAERLRVATWCVLAGAVVLGFYVEVEVWVQVVGWLAGPGAALLVVAWLVGGRQRWVDVRKHDTMRFAPPGDTGMG